MRNKHLHILNILFLSIVFIIMLSLTYYDAPTSGEEQEEPSWPKAVQSISIPSSQDGSLQDAYFISSDGKAPLIISLHQWSATYDRFDPLSHLALENNWNYIRPNFRGANNNPDAGGSDLVIRDIDDAIDYALKHSDVDASEIHIIGASGGGHAALMHLMRGHNQISSYSVWVPVVDLVAWYGESVLRNNGYDNDIMAVTGSVEHLNVMEARNRSPLHQTTPVDRVNNTEVHLFAGINDGYNGSVPISHSINFYNKLIADMNYPVDHKISDGLRSELVYTQNVIESNQEKYLGEREVIYYQSSNNLSLTLFDGHHEILYNEAFTYIYDMIK